MVRPPKTHHPEEDIEEEEEADYGDDFPTRQDSSLRGEAGRVDGKKANTPRSKHSETEQRRRSKINERFQILRDLIPQNDTKRDKASFLLEVIEYIQFLREKLQVYEGSYHGYNQEPSKLTPWRNNSVPVESHMEHSQVMKNGVGHENSIIVNPEMVITNAQNSLGSDLENASVPTQMQFGSVSNIENVVSHSESQLWQVMPFTADCAAPNISQDQHEQLSIESGTVSLSSAYSQGILNTLTQALQSSGVDMSQARISVKVDVGKRMGNAAAGTSSLKDRESSQEAGVQGYTRGESDIRLHKRHRAENS